ncbi:DUF742 domain-containing protein [Streptomyces sp. NPDC006335]|uniref:DUF742 domain-containing protein n=1 Tax=Streptomyces sp. NPDC006335 TaxID=3156895 RepID=UPI0033A910F4
MAGHGQPVQPRRGATAFVRNYVLTGGRTRARHMLSADTMVEAGPGHPGRFFTDGEYHQFIALCRVRCRSVTELAGTVGVPLSVARVLISDLLDARVLVLPVVGTGFERADSPDDPRGDSPSRQLLEKLRVGLVNLPA